MCGYISAFANTNIILFHHASFWLGWVMCFCRWHASFDCMSGVVTWIHFIIIFIVIIEILSWREECWLSTFETKMKNVPWFERLFKRRTWLEEQVLVNTIWTGDARIMNMSKSAEIYPNIGKYSSINGSKNVTWCICLNMCETLRS